MNVGNLTVRFLPLKRFLKTQYSLNINPYRSQDTDDTGSEGYNGYAGEL